MAETLEDGAARREYLTYVFVGAGYAGLEGLAELQDFAADVDRPLPALPRAPGMRWILVEAGERVMPEIPREARRVRRARAARPRHRDPHEHDARGGHRRHGAPVRRRGGPDAHARLDGGRQAAPGRRAARPAARPSAGGSQSTRTCRSPGHDERVGDRRLRRGARSRAQGRAVPADRAARDPPGPRRRAQRRRGARRAAGASGRSATRRRASSSTWAAARRSR